MSMIPDQIRTVEELDDVMSTPSDKLVQFVARLESPLLVLGAGGKMGPSLCALAKRAIDKAGTDADVIAVSRFSNEAGRAWLEHRGVRTLKADLLDQDSLDRLPDADNIVYLAGHKFGTADAPWRTWAINALVPAFVCRRYTSARIVALSSGNVYPFAPSGSGGANEETPVAPIGEYANSCVARERVFEYFGSEHGLRSVLVRLNYAVDLRYGVIVDIVEAVRSGRPVDVSNGYFNCIWQRDANDAIIRSLRLAAKPPRVINLTGKGELSVQRVAQRAAELLGKKATFAGTESPTALLSDSSLANRLLGEPQTPIDRVIEWTVEWLRSGRRTLGKPTHFEVRDGAF